MLDNFAVNNKVIMKHKIITSHKDFKLEIQAKSLIINHIIQMKKLTVQISSGLLMGITPFMPMVDLTLPLMN
jgi:hypothetical protein